ncbi:MAG TPA: hypothetical protein VFM05_03535 [Candidatus Saccharimonadales bacterium]|nr:hypothetical protein [Candidatus Saccharimonadales bacterium]
MTEITNEQIKNKLDSIDRWRVKMQTEHEKHDKTLYGNGEPGMDEQIRNIVAWISRQDEAVKRRAAWWDKFQWVVIPIVITGLVTFFYQAFVFYFRIVPLLEAVKP